MRNSWKNVTLILSLGGLLASAPMLVFGGTQEQSLTSQAGTNVALERQVRHELAMLPYYGVFDNLEYRVNGDQVELSGQVVNPVLKSEAENVVKRLKGVEVVNNEIQVLPPSFNDGHIRLAVYRAVFRSASLYRYAMGANPSIHIIVNNGNVTLDGAVSNQMDKNIANLAANSVPGVFTVTNNLHVGS